MRAVFLGTPAFAAPTLRRLAESSHEVLAVFTQPDRPAGRGRRLTPPPVKQAALELGLPVEQPERIKTPEAFHQLQRLAPDVIVVVGYGQILPQRILDLPPLGCINVHSSLLPKYRGAAPMNWAIANGETTTGVCTMQLVLKMDAGDVLLCRETEIGPEETAPELAERLAPMGAELLLATLEGLEGGKITPRTQNHEEATYAPILKREDGEIDWAKPASEIFNRVRGFDPWPGAFARFRGKRFHVRRARLATGTAAAGEIVVDNNLLLVGCGDGGLLEVVEAQLEGKPRLPAAAFVHGYRPKPGERLH